MFLLHFLVRLYPRGLIEQFTIFGNNFCFPQKAILLRFQKYFSFAANKNRFFFFSVSMLARISFICKCYTRQLCFGAAHEKLINIYFRGEKTNFFESKRICRRFRARLVDSTIRTRFCDKLGLNATHSLIIGVNFD